MRGITTIELTDVRTGEVKKYEDHNMFTKALDSVYNGAPYSVNNEVFGRRSEGNQNMSYWKTILGYSLGGLLLFPENIDENADTVFAPANNKPTGIASYDGYSGSDSRRGSLNEIESGPITGGYRFVWDFATSQANGTIKCASLTSAQGGIGYLDSTSFLKDRNSSYDSPIGLWSSIINRNLINIGGNDRGLYFIERVNTNAPIFMMKTPAKKFTLQGNPFEVVQVATVDRLGIPLLNGDELWILVYSSNSGGNANIQIDKYNIDTWEKSTASITVAAQLYFDTYIYTCISNGYIYLPHYNRKDAYKINLSNVADVELLTNGSNPGGARWGYVPFNGGVLSRTSLIEADGTVHSMDLRGAPLAINGAWILSTNTNGNNITIGATIITPYIATINNLDQVIQKNAQQTMKVTYTVYEE